jgi:DNA-binding MarR family transcriptional regulator
MAGFTLAEFLPYQLSVTSNAVSRAVAAGTGYESRFGLNAAEWRVLAVVTAAGMPTQAELIAATGMDKMTISRAVSALHGRGLIDRVRDDGDRRTSRLNTTSAGEAIHDVVAPQALEVEAQLLAALSPAEAKALRAALAKLRRACDRT